MQEKKNFILSIISLFVVTIIFWVVWIVRADAWVAYQEQKVKMLGSVLIILATIMIANGCLVFRIARPSYMLFGLKKKMLFAMGSLFLVVVVNFFMLYQVKDYGYSITTLATVENKESEGGSYHFQILDSADRAILDFVCEKDVYDAIKVKDCQYQIHYRRLVFGSKKAVLGYIDVNNAKE